MDEKIRQFLRLPFTALRAAHWVNGETGGEWAAIRNAAAGILPVHLCGEKIILRADCDGWRDGVMVTL
jgi:hypothetical protein